MHAEGPEAGQAFRLDKRRVRRAFEQAAATYDEAAVLQREVGRRLDERLEYIRIRPRTILDLGCGTGFTGALLRRRYRGAWLLSLDLAPAMLQRARRDLPLWRRLGRRDGFVCADAEHLPCRPESFDLVVSNLTLQWLNEPEATFAGLRQVLRPGGLFLFTTFGPDTLLELRRSWAAVDQDVHVHAFLDMHDIGDALMRAGFADPVLDVERFTLTYRELRQLMADLKCLGARNTAAGRPRGLTTPARLRRVARAYEAYRRDGLLPATYEVVYGHCWIPKATSPARKGPRRPPQIASVPLERLRRGGQIENRSGEPEET